MDVIIGILAGMRPRSTSPFLETVLDFCQKQYGAKWDMDFPRILIYSLPTPFHPKKPIDEKKNEATACFRYRWFNQRGRKLYRHSL